jgi:hypothetical protein
VLAKCESDISAAQLFRDYRLGYYGVAIQHVRLHAPAVREKTHLQAALQHSFAEHRELRRITPQ